MFQKVRKLKNTRASRSRMKGLQTSISSVPWPDSQVRGRDGLVNWAGDPIGLGEVKKPWGW